MEANSGAEFSLISKRRRDELNIMAPEQVCDLKLKQFDKSIIHVNTVFWVNAKYNDAEFIGKFYIVEGNNDTLMGRD